MKTRIQRRSAAEPSRVAMSPAVRALGARRRSSLAGAAWLLLLLAVTPPVAEAGAVDFAKSEPRWVAVQVVTSVPGDPESRLSAPAFAWYAPGPGATQRTVTVPGTEVERTFFADRSPVDGSFSDFVWVFDAATGHLVSASVSGQVVEGIRVGPVRMSAQVAIAVELSTTVPGGYRTPRQLAGRTIVGYCSEPDEGCTSVESAVYDIESGRVRANGAVCAVWRSVHTQAYTAIGQATFVEVEPGRGPASVRRVSPPVQRTARVASAAHSC